MNKFFKKTVIAVSILLILFLMMGFAFSSGNNSSNSSFEKFYENSNSQSHDINISGNVSLNDNGTSDDFKENEETPQNSSGNNNSSNLTNNSSISDNTPEEMYESTKVNYKPLTTDYTEGYVFFPVYAYDIVSYDGIRYINPKYNSIVKLIVFTGSTFKNYSGKIGDNGIAQVKLYGLSIGNHIIKIHVDGKYYGSSSIKVLKSTARVYAPLTQVNYNRTNYFFIRVIDTHNFNVKVTILKIKVYSGSKYKIYTVRTNAAGLARMHTKGLSLGVHNVIIYSVNSKFNINKASKIIVRKSANNTVKQVVGYTQNGIVKYKDKTYFKITVKNTLVFPVKQLLLNVKVNSGKYYNIYKVRTNSNGVASLNTGGLSLGNHNVLITSANTNYLLKKISLISVQKNVVNNKIEKTRLKSLIFNHPGNDYFAKLTWTSKKNADYQILRKSEGNFKIIATVTANSEEMSFIDKVCENDSYTYSVREIITKGNTKILGPYDSEGLKLLKYPTVSVEFYNNKAVIHWSKVSGATKYLIYNKIGKEGKFKLIGTADGSKLNFAHYYYKSAGDEIKRNFTEYYYKSAPDISDKLIKGVFIDPSSNDLVYTVRACTIGKVDGVEKTSFGTYLIDGDFHLECPTIISLSEGIITWDTVPNADGYLILKNNNSDNVWNVIKQVTKNTEVHQSAEIGEIEKDSYYAVQAYSNKNGEIIYGGYDEGFTLKHFSQNYSNNSILYIGDSLTFGAYYSSSKNDLFSIPYRVAQLIGGVYYNPSIMGSTYHSLEKNINNVRDVLINAVINPIYSGKPPFSGRNMVYTNNSIGQANTRIADYDVVVMAAGTNDYITDAKLGSLNSNDTKTFNGAINYILNKIEKSSEYRVNHGKTPIKVVFVDLYYSDTVYDPKKITNRDVTPNNIGLTLTNYQNALNNQIKKWNTSEFLTFYQFKTRSYNIVTQHNCAYTTSDNLHLTRASYSKYGNAFAEFLVNNVYTNSTVNF